MPEFSYTTLSLIIKSKITNTSMEYTLNVSTYIYIYIYIYMWLCVYNFITDK